MASSDSREKLVGDLSQLVSDASEFVRVLHEEWDDYNDLYQGIQDDGLQLSPDDLLDWAPVNLIFSNIETCVPILADAAPLWYVVSPDGQHEEQASKLTDVLQAVWFSERVGRQYKMALRDQLLLGTGFLKPWFNPEAGPVEDEFQEDLSVKSRHLGAVQVSWVDPYAVYPDPAARNIEECEYLALAHDVVADRAKRLWPKFDKEQAQTSLDDLDRPQNWLQKALAWVFGRGATNPYTNRTTYRVWEMYHEAGQRLTIFTGKQVLFDGPNPTPGEQFPLAVFPNCERGYGFFGMPITSQVRALQRKINTTNLMLHQHLRSLGRMQYFTTDGNVKSQMQSSKGRPGEIFTSNKPDAKPSALEPAVLPQWTFAHLRETFEDVKTVTGVQDVIRGLRPGSIQSGVGIQQLQESSLTRLRDLSRDNAGHLERLGQIVLEFVQGKYEEPRDFAYMRGSELVRQKFDPSLTSEPIGNPMAGMNEPGMDPMAEAMGLGPAGGLAQQPELSAPIAYRVVVEQGNSLPLNSMAQAEVAMRLFQMRDENGLPVIDAEALLDAVKFNRRQEVIQRRQEKQQMMMQGQMAAQQQQVAMQAQAGAQAGPPMGPEGLGPVPQQDASGALMALLQPILQAVGPDGEAMLTGIIEAVVQQQPLTTEQTMWLDSLPVEIQQQLEQVLQLLGLGQGVPAAGPAGLV